MSKEKLLIELQKVTNDIYKLFLQIDDNYIEGRVFEAKEELQRIFDLEKLEVDIHNIEYELNEAISLLQSALTHMEDAEYRGTMEQKLELNRFITRLKDIKQKMLKLG